MPAQKGSKVLGSRKRLDREISDQIRKRDEEAVDTGDRKFGVWSVGNTKSPMYPGEYGKGTKSEAYGYKDAVKRLNRQFGVAHEGFDADTGRKITKKEGDATRKRLMDRYGVKKMAKGGSTASKRADGCCTKGKTRGKVC